MIYFIYILECSNGALYTGYTTDLNRRYQEHCTGTSKCKYTRSFPPQRLAAAWKLEGSLSEILKIEAFIKSLSKPKKHALTCNTLSFKQLLQNQGYSTVIIG